MAPSSYSASAPGSIMLFGEHAVLHGQSAIAGAVDRRLRVTLTPQAGRQVEIDSDLGTYRAAVDTLDPDTRFAFLLEAVRRAGPLPSGFNLQVRSAFSSKVGFGSSAAVTAAACAVFAAWKEQPAPPEKLLAQVVGIIRAVQGTGSGSDAAASVYGGVLAYRADSMETVPIDFLPPVSVVYCGYKTPTVEVIRRVEAEFRERPGALTALYEEMGALAAAAAEALRRRDLVEAGDLMNRSQDCMSRLGVSDPALDRIVAGLRNQAEITGAKISGSGLGDCVIGLGRTQAAVEGFEKMDAVLSPDGVCMETYRR